MEDVYNGLKQAFDYIFRSRAARGLLDEEKCERASTNARYLFFVLELFHDKVKRRYPYRVDILDVVEKIIQSLRYEHSGMLPDRMMRGYIFIQPLSPQGLETFNKIIDRWLDTKAIEEEFFFSKLHYYKTNNIVNSADKEDDARWKTMYDTEEHASETAEEMKKWLLSRHGTLDI